MRRGTDGDSDHAFPWWIDSPASSAATTPGGLAAAPPTGPSTRSGSRSRSVDPSAAVAAGVFSLEKDAATSHAEQTALPREDEADEISAAEWRMERGDDDRERRQHGAGGAGAAGGGVGGGIGGVKREEGEEGEEEEVEIEEEEEEDDDDDDMFAVEGGPKPPKKTRKVVRRKKQAGPVVSAHVLFEMVVVHRIQEGGSAADSVFPRTSS